MASACRRAKISCSRQPRVSTKQLGAPIIAQGGELGIITSGPVTLNESTNNFTYLAVNSSATTGDIACYQFDRIVCIECAQHLSGIHQWHPISIFR